PIFENSFKKLAFEEGISDQINIQGKNLFPQNGEFTAELLLEKISQLTGMEFTKVLVPDDIIQIPTRAPQLCPGCSHRHTFYALNKISKKLKKKFINCTDIGCYTLGIYKPLEVGDCAICMGGSIGLANGFAKLIPKDTPILAILGDSTFYHSGIPSLINAIYNQNDLLLLILDNGSTSMTGGQDNPGTGIKITQEPGTKVKIEFIVHGCGVDPNKIWVQESNDLPRLIKNLEEAVETTGVRVFISKHLCSLIEMRQFRAQKVKIPVVKVDPDKCIGCQLCIKEFGCPAIIFNFEEKKAIIDEAQCRGCKVCIDICAKRAFYEEFD
ncbi:MAG: indolepyruvate ferredoxin oxidoreductase subunit alpha, partial [archaeon]|nr:indolepyruvate ferredoxin oxidoreductase subunit alpha [archaeon]